MCGGGLQGWQHAGSPIEQSPRKGHSTGVVVHRGGMAGQAPVNPPLSSPLHSASLACPCAGNVANTLCIVLLLVIQGATGKQVTEQQVSSVPGCGVTTAVCGVPG